MIEYVTPITVATPCVGVCVMDDDTGWCDGCGRTLAEIAGWLAMTSAERDAIMTDLSKRRAV